MTVFKDRQGFELKYLIINVLHKCSITDTSQSDVQGAESGNFSTSEVPLLSNLWGPRSLRWVRNWIREKAQKEAKDKPKSLRSCSLRDMMEQFRLLWILS